ncbi:hypothetical protein EJ03DRAFT_178724 [Teratosphaeria nubilosa]|uniref:Uncharacterized protein n=1 Tax=Teratosphaeria nubilosa TaxID=161662 RepID=A0A6G1L0K8_9PEZI|nr:hypothetical protein EJ03DRAFT_178724 [Teratosphaeria nubilosa]
MPPHNYIPHPTTPPSPPLPIKPTTLHPPPKPEHTHAHTRAHTRKKVMCTFTLTHLPTCTHDLPTLTYCPAADANLAAHDRQQKLGGRNLKPAMVISSPSPSLPSSSNVES